MKSLSLDCQEMPPRIQASGVTRSPLRKFMPLFIRVGVGIGASRPVILLIREDLRHIDAYGDYTENKEMSRHFRTQIHATTE